MGEHYLSKFSCALHQYKIFFLIIKNGSTWKTVPDNDEDLQEQPPDPPEPTETEVENEPENIENEPEIAEIQPEIIEIQPEIQPETKKRGRPKKEPAPKPEPKKRGRPPKPIVTPVQKHPLWQNALLPHQL